MRNHQRLLSTLAAVAAAATLAGCANQPLGYPAAQSYPATQSYPQGQVYPQNQGNYSSYGRVSNVEYLRGRGQSQGVAGAVIGGAVGGLAGSQIGGGRGRTAATVAGVVGGALIGRALEQNMQGAGHDYYRVTVQFDNGGVQTYDYADAPNVRVGDRVRAEGNQLYR